MMKSLLIIFLLCISNFVGMAKNTMDYSPDGSPCKHQTELSIANSMSEHSVLPASITEYSSSELNINFDIQNKLKATHLYIVNLLRNGIDFNEIKRYYFIQKGPVFLTIFGL